jgi:rod shape-determining protein MreB
MGLFSFTQEIAMDLGTANTIIITGGKIVVDEPSVVALDRRTDKMIAVGEKAKLMHEKTHENIRTIRPLRDGVIADFYACEQMMRGLIKQVNTRNRLFSPSLRMECLRVVRKLNFVLFVTLPNMPVDVMFIWYLNLWPQLLALVSM